MNYKQYLKESPDNIVVDGKTINHGYFTNNVPFFNLKDLFVFAQIQNGLKIIAVENNKIVLDIINNSFVLDEITHQNLSLSLYEYATYKNQDKAEKFFEIKTDEIKDVGKLRIKIEDANYSQTTGRIFTNNKVVAVRGNKIDHENLKQAFNTASAFKTKIDDTWFFERTNDKTAEETKSSYKDLTKTEDVIKSLITFNKTDNPFPELIMDADWRNAVRVLGDGFVNNIKLAYSQMDNKAFEKFMQNQLPKIKKASLQIGESK